MYAMCALVFWVLTRVNQISRNSEETVGLVHWNTHTPKNYETLADHELPWMRAVILGKRPTSKSSEYKRMSRVKNCTPLQELCKEYFALLFDDFTVIAGGTWRGWTRVVQANYKCREGKTSSLLVIIFRSPNRTQKHTGITPKNVRTTWTTNTCIRTENKCEKHVL